MPLLTELGGREEVGRIENLKFEISEAKWRRRLRL